MTLASSDALNRLMERMQEAMDELWAETGGSFDRLQGVLESLVALIPDGSPTDATAERGAPLHAALSLAAAQVSRSLRSQLSVGAAAVGHAAVVRPEQHGPVVGTVVMWNNEDGWGAISSPEVEGEVWAHYSNVVGPGYRSLTAGEVVSFTYETPGQDGYPHRAISVEQSAS